MKTNLNFFTLKNYDITLKRKKRNQINILAPEIKTSLDGLNSRLDIDYKISKIQENPIENIQIEVHRE